MMRVNISLPKRFVQELRANVAKRSLSAFLREAAEEKIAREKWQSAFARFMSLPPTLTNIADPVRWVEELRAQEEERLTRQGV